MKKLLTFLMVASLATAVMAADLSLRVAADSAGRVDDSTIDVSTVTAGDEIKLEVVLSNLDFTLAGAEGNFLFPAWLSVVRTDNVAGPDAPFTLDTASLGTTSVQALPADSSGANTASTFKNAEGVARTGFVITDPASRPTTGDIVLFVLRFEIGRDIDINLVTRALSTCISSSETIEFLACNTGAASCHIIADDSAAAVNVNFTQADLQVSLINSNTAIVKGDVNGANGLTTADISPLIQCAFFGQGSAGCPLSGASADDYAITADINCDGNVSTGDVSPAIGRALGTINRLANKNMEFFALGSEQGVLELKSSEVGSVASLEIAVKGNVSFEEIQLEQNAAGWSVSSAFNAQENVFKFIVFNLTGKDSAIPALQIPYQIAGKGEIAIRSAENYMADSSPSRYAPSIEDYAMNYGEDKSSKDKQQTIK